MQRDISRHLTRPNLYLEVVARCVWPWHINGPYSRDTAINLPLGLSCHQLLYHKHKQITHHTTYCRPLRNRHEPADCRFRVTTQARLVTTDDAVCNLIISLGNGNKHFGSRATTQINLIQDRWNNWTCLLQTAWHKLQFKADAFIRCFMFISTTHMGSNHRYKSNILKIFFNETKTRDIHVYNIPS